LKEVGATTKDVCEVLSSRTLSMMLPPLPTDAERTNAQATEHQAQANLLIAVSLLDSELDELIEYVAQAADRAESGSYDMAGTPKARAIAMQRAKRLYALASRLESTRQS
jgi:hypothetical protein